MGMCGCKEEFAEVQLYFSAPNDNPSYTVILLYRGEVLLSDILGYPIFAYIDKADPNYENKCVFIGNNKYYNIRIGGDRVITDIQTVETATTVYIIDVIKCYNDNTYIELRTNDKESVYLIESATNITTNSYYNIDFVYIKKRIRLVKALKKINADEGFLVKKN